MNQSSLWKILLLGGITLSLVAFVLGWIGFGVADWHSFQRFNGSINEFYGLWAYCQEQTNPQNTVCQRWPTAEDQLFNGSRPNFIRTSEGLFTTGMILLSVGLFSAFFAMALPLLSYVAALVALLAFIFLVVALPIFGRQSNDFSQSRGDAVYSKRYGFWLMVPTIILEFLSILAFLGAGFLYRLFGFGNLSTETFDNSVYGGMKVAGIPNVIIPPSYGQLPLASAFDDFLATSPPYYPSVNGQSQPIANLLSEYLNQRMASPYGQTLTLPPIVTGTMLPQQSLSWPFSSQSTGNAIPAYFRAEPAGPPYQPIVNLTGRTIVGPIMRSL